MSLLVLGAALFLYRKPIPLPFGRELGENTKSTLETLYWIMAGSLHSLLGSTQESSVWWILGLFTLAAFTLGSRKRQYPDLYI